MPLYGPPCLPLSGGTMTGAQTWTIAGGTTTLTRASSTSTTITDTSSGAQINLVMRDKTYQFSDGSGSGFICPMNIFMNWSEIRLVSGARFGWSSNSGVATAASADAGFGRVASGVVEVNTGTLGTYAALIASEIRTGPTSANGQYIAEKSLTELLTIAASATTDTVIQIPANAIVLGVSVRNTVAVTCTSTYTVGDSGNASRYSTAAVSKVVNSTDPGTKAGAYYNASAVSVRITPDTTPSDATGRVRVTVHYIAVTAPTS